MSSSKLKAKIESHLKKIETETSGEFKKPIAYAMALGGKRVRPILTLLAHRIFSPITDESIEIACAIEMFHNFTLLHDDVMDHSLMRRGVFTVHKKWDEATAILVGDVMMIQVYQKILKVKNHQSLLLSKFNQMAIDVCRGQQQDMNFEKRQIIDEAEYLEMIRLKTAVLIGFSLEIGALLGGATEKQQKVLYDFGEKLGLAFQLKDDWLDTFGNAQTFGKKIGNDILTNKKTHLLVQALLLSKGETRKKLEAWLFVKDFVPKQKISEVILIYNQLEIGENTNQLIKKYFKTAFITLQTLEPLNNENVTAPLITFTKQLMNREK